VIPIFITEEIRSRRLQRRHSCDAIFLQIIASHEELDQSLTAGSERSGPFTLPCDSAEAHNAITCFQGRPHSPRTTATSEYHVSRAKFQIRVNVGRQFGAVSETGGV
jgi:hypothetical protein